jgi:two-component system, cell cycle response regulator DivK
MCATAQTLMLAVRDSPELLQFVELGKKIQLQKLNCDMVQTRVLVVDDNEAFIEMTKFVLSEAGHLVDAASDAGSALSMIPVFLPDVILMDIQMPMVNGIELTKRLKANPATRNIPVIAFTAHASKGDEHELKATGFDGYIGKPVNVTTLAAELAFWLDGPESARRSHFVWP